MCQKKRDVRSVWVLWWGPGGFGVGAMVRIYYAAIIHHPSYAIRSGELEAMLEARRR